MKYNLIFITSLLLTAVLYNQIIMSPGFFMEDDSYFYAQTAYNIGVNGISSFDGNNITDGYHLAWCWLLASISWILHFFTVNKDIHLYSFLSLYVFLLLVLANKISGNIFKTIISFLILIVTAFLMEDVLVSLTFILLIQRSNKHKIDAIFYILVYVLPIIRIDALIYTGVFLVLFYRKDFKVLSFSIFFLALGAISQLTLNNFLFDSIFSVSAMIKMDMNRDIIDNIEYNLTLFDEFHNKLLSLCCLGGLISFVYLILKSKDSTKNALLIFSFLSVLTFFIYLLMFVPHLRQWYLTTIKTVSLMIIYQSGILNYFERKVKYFWELVSVAFIFAFIYLYIDVHLLHDNDWKYTKQFISFVKEIVPENEPIYQIDASGIVGYFSGRKIVNGDGLINSHEYYNYVKNKKIRQFIKRNNIKYFIINRELKKNCIICWRGLRLTENELTLLKEPDRKLYYDFNVFRLYKLKENRDL